MVTIIRMMMSNSLVYAEDGDNCKDGECVDEKEKMIFCANILLGGTKPVMLAKK